MITDSDDDPTTENRHKKVKLNTTADDKLSELPYFLIHHILSFLDTKEVVKTSLLSKKWQFIWTGISKIDLSLHVSYLDDASDAAKIHWFVNFVDKMLDKCKLLNKFVVNFPYEKLYDSHVNFWVECLVKNKVKDVILISRSIDILNPYEIPQMLYSHSYLISLTIHTCAMALPQVATIEWSSLRSLSIEDVELSDYVMEKILSGCPVLEFLSLISVWGHFSLLNISSRNLTTLVIEEHDYFGDLVEVLEISAPYITDLRIIKNVEGMRFRLKNISSVVRAEVDLYGISCLSDPDTYTSPASMAYINQLFESLQFVKELQLGSVFIEVISMLELNGWKIPPSTGRLCLTIDAFNHEGSIPGILSILKSSPCLETLFIKGDHIYFDDEEDLITCDPAKAYLKNANLDIGLNHLKTIVVKSFTQSVIDCEPLLTMARLLLKSAKILKDMIITCPSPLFAEEYRAKLGLRLLTFPRASPEAVVLV